MRSLWKKRPTVTWSSFKSLAKCNKSHWHNWCFSFIKRETNWQSIQRQSANPTDPFNNVSPSMLFRWDSLPFLSDVFLIADYSFAWKVFAVNLQIMIILKGKCYYEYLARWWKVIKGNLSLSTLSFLVEMKSIKF